jgi:hypothetical protein
MNRTVQITQTSPTERVNKAIANSKTVAAALIEIDNMSPVKVAQRMGVSTQRLAWAVDEGRAVLTPSELAVLAKLLRCDSRDLLLKPTHELINRIIRRAAL